MHLSASYALVSVAAAVLSVTAPVTSGAEGLTNRIAVVSSDPFVDDTVNADCRTSLLHGSSPAAKSDQTPGTNYSISGGDIQRLAARGPAEITSLQAGVVSDHRTGDLYVRGSEASGLIYYVDGVPMQNAFTGMALGRVPNASIENILVTTGGLGAGYGWGMSGATEISTFDGGRKLHGATEAITDNFHGERQDYNLYGLSLNGPLLPNSDRLTFSVAGERRWLRNGQPRGGLGGLLRSNSFGWTTWNGKLHWKPTQTLVARLGAFGSRDDWRIYLPAYYFDIAHAPRSMDRSSGFWGEITHDLSRRTSYTLRGYWTSQDSRAGDGVYFDNLWGYGRPNGNPLDDATGLFWSWDDMQLDPDSLAIGVHHQLRTPVRDTVITVTLPDGSTVQKSFVVGGDEGSVWDDYVRREGSYIGGKADLVSQIGAKHTLKVGTEFQRHTLRYYHHFFPTEVYSGRDGGFRDADFYGFDELGQDVNGGFNGAKHPISFAWYVQDRITWSRLVLTIGLRSDYFDYDAYGLRSLTTPLDPDHILSQPHPSDSLVREANQLTKSDLESRRSTWLYIVRRLAASYQVSGGPLLHFASDGHVQRPELGMSYSNFDFMEYKMKYGGYSVPLGNAYLKPPTVHSLELGARQRITEYLTFDLTGFYKDHSDLIGIITQPATPNNYTTYANVGDLTSKGLEFQVRMQRRWGISGQLNYTIQKAESSFLQWPDPDNIPWSGSGDAVRVSGPVGYDQRHTFTAIIDARLADKAGPRIGSFYPLERSGLNLVFNAASGFPYTPTKVYGSVILIPHSPVPAGPYHSSRVPATYRLDLKADKAFSLGSTTLDFYLWVLNVFNRANVLDVYSASGMPDDDGWLNTEEGQSYVSNAQTVMDSSRMTGEQKYRFRENDPLNYDTPRQIRLGMLLTF